MTVIPQLELSNLFYMLFQFFEMSFPNSDVNTVEDWNTTVSKIPGNFINSCCWDLNQHRCCVHNSGDHWAASIAADVIRAQCPLPCCVIVKYKNSIWNFSRPLTHTQESLWKDDVCCVSSSLAFSPFHPFIKMAYKRKR